ncbi:MAG TPA: hypothetical protein VMV33_17275 [Rhodocyclaceae bacterium]|nr:hypothetical protein [Rhodocyclaceae bacterium]
MKDAAVPFGFRNQRGGIGADVLRLRAWLQKIAAESHDLVAASQARSALAGKDPGQ